MVRVCVLSCTIKDKQIEHESRYHIGVQHRDSQTASVKGSLRHTIAKDHDHMLMETRQRSQDTGCGTFYEEKVAQKTIHDTEEVASSADKRKWARRKLCHGTRMKALPDIWTEKDAAIRCWEEQIMAKEAKTDTAKTTGLMWPSTWRLFKHIRSKCVHSILSVCVRMAWQTEDCNGETEK